MLHLIAAVQPVLLAAVLIPAAHLKLFGGHRADGVRATALASLLGTTRALHAYRFLGILELLIGMLLIAPPARTVNAVAAIGLAIGFLGYLAYARHVGPESSCGCLHSRRATPVSWRSFARAGLLVLAGLLATQAAGYWLDVVVAHPLTATAILTVEAVAVVLLSPELGLTRPMQMRHLRSRLPRPLISPSGLTLNSSVQQLQHSPAYQRIAGQLHPEILDSWRDQEWRILCYNARHQGRPATAAFAVPLRRYDPGAVRVTLVDEFTGDTLLATADLSLSTPAGS
jgi:hypothetical protein